MNAQQTVDIELIKHAEASAKLWREKRDRCDANAKAWDLAVLERFDAAFPIGTLVSLSPKCDGYPVVTRYIVGRDGGMGVWVAMGSGSECVHYSRIKHVQ